jgi:molecular chaperone GrpE
MFEKLKKVMSKKQQSMKDETLNKDTTVEDVLENQEGVENEENVNDDGASEEGTEATKEELLQQEIEELRAHISELKDKNLRQAAEFQNFRNRSTREKLDLMASAAKDTLSALLPVVDDFDRAKKISDDESTDEAFSEGVKLVYDKFKGILKAKGLKAMESTGEVFDAELHEALTEIPAPTEELKGKVVDTIETGYTLNDKIIRHAKVVVGK